MFDTTIINMHKVSAEGHDYTLQCLDQGEGCSHDKASL